MTAIEPEDAPPASEDRIAVIAAAIVGAYGEDAVVVAQSQFDAADDASQADWAAILARLQRR